MRRVLRRFYVAAIVLPVVVLAGSSECRALDPVPVVRSEVAAAVYVQQWGQILWGLVTSQTGTQPTSFGDPILNPDGSVTQSFIAADGTETTLTSFLDGSAVIELRLPTGVTQTVWQSIPAFDGTSKTTINWTITSSDGLSVEYTSVVDDQGTFLDMSDDTTQLLGSSVLPEGITQTFTALTAAGRTDLLSTHSDGSTFALSVPLMPPAFMGPDFSQQASGTYTDPNFTVNFTLASTPTDPARWAAFLCDVGWGITGTFSLDQDFSGFGQLEESSVLGPTLVALASWTHDGQIEVYSLSGQNLYMGPSGAALDFLAHRWQTLTALLAPSPGLSVTPPVSTPRRPVGPRLQPRRPRDLERQLRAVRTPLPSTETHRDPQQDTALQDALLSGKSSPRGTR